jgi:hypothetical protein
MNYVVGEVLPFSQAKNGNPFLIVAGGQLRRVPRRLLRL